MRNNSGVEVIAFRDGERQEFGSIKKACEAYGISHDRLVGLVMCGDDLDGVCFDWSERADDDAIAQVEETWRKWASNASRRKQEWRLAQANGRNRGLSVLALSSVGSRRFTTLSDACEEFSISRDRLIGLIISGDKLNGTSFQWDRYCDPDSKFACLVAYFVRLSKNSDKHRRMKDAKRAAFEHMDN